MASDISQPRPHDTLEAAHTDSALASVQDAPDSQHASAADLHGSPPTRSGRCSGRSRTAPGGS